MSISVIELGKANRSDPVLSKVHQYLQRGWPIEINNMLKPYLTHRTELSIEEGCIMSE